ncbi:hypothetical protein EPN44_00650 [bacterium]|nr:MAG: hypothetical protein EPN44_00650 [bacterium]
MLSLILNITIPALILALFAYLIYRERERHAEPAGPMQWTASAIAVAVLFMMLTMLAVRHHGLSSPLVYSAWVVAGVALATLLYRLSRERG